jgi:hypothetical protein
MTPLRQRMIEDMQLRNLSTETQRASLHYITGLARFYQTSPEHLGLEELREYQLYMINERQYSPESVNHFVAAAKFLYNVTLETPWPEDALPRCRVPHKLPVVLSPVEVDEFFQHVPTSELNRSAVGRHCRHSCPPARRPITVGGPMIDALVWGRLATCGPIVNRSRRAPARPGAGTSKLRST